MVDARLFIRCNVSVMVSAIFVAVGGGCRSNWLKISRTWGTVIAGVFFPHSLTFQHQEPQGQ